MIDEKKSATAIGMKQPNTGTPVKKCFSYLLEAADKENLTDPGNALDSLNIDMIGFTHAIQELMLNEPRHLAAARAIRWGFVIGYYYAKQQSRVN